MMTGRKNVQRFLHYNNQATGWDFRDCKKDGINMKKPGKRFPAPDANLLMFCEP
jgi:hypothetical protein